MTDLTATKLRVVARAIASDACPYEAALALVEHAYRLGLTDGQLKANRAQLRASKAAADERRKSRESAHG